MHIHKKFESNLETNETNGQAVAIEQNPVILKLGIEVIHEFGRNWARNLITS